MSSVQPAFNVAVAGMTSPEAGLRYYQDLLDYVGKQLSRPVKMTQRKTYQEVNDLLVEGELDVAFLCSGGFVAAEKTLSPEIVAVPVVRGKTTYQAYIIVNRNSRIRSFKGLRRRSFAFTDPLSNTGWLYPVSRLSDLGVTPSSFFSRITYTYGHDRSIEAVGLGITDGASVDSLVYDHVARTDPETIKAVRIIERSPEFAIPPVVAGPRMDPSLKAEFRAVLFGMHEDAEGRRILRSLLIDKFVRGEADAYESIRQMSKKVGPWRP